jgi:hypothetical protein
VRHPSSRITGPIHTKALEHLERGRLHLLNGSHFALEHAVDSFRAAVRADASDARAYAGLALARCTQAQHLADAPRRAYADATHAALAGLGARPERYLAFALWKLGRYDAVTNEPLRQADAFGIARETLTHAAGASSQTWASEARCDTSSGSGLPV